MMVKPNFNDLHHQKDDGYNNNDKDRHHQKDGGKINNKTCYHQKDDGHHNNQRMIVRPTKFKDFHHQKDDVHHQKDDGCHNKAFHYLKDNNKTITKRMIVNSSTSMITITKRMKVISTMKLAIIKRMIVSHKNFKDRHHQKDNG